MLKTSRVTLVICSLYGTSSKTMTQPHQFRRP
ncbi:hypothetical protein EniLVp02_0188 [Vibrio phage EniLVp02]